MSGQNVEEHDPVVAQMVLRNVEALGSPETEHEAIIFAEVLTLPRVVVSRQPVKRLLAAGMIPYNCHVNCHNQEARDPAKQSRHVTGWLIHGSNLILHSVVVTWNQWICITPQLDKAANQFEFIPDFDIEWRDNPGGWRDPVRKGVVVPDILRKNPAREIEKKERFLELLNSGLSIKEAQQSVQAEYPSVSINP